MVSKSWANQKQGVSNLVAAVILVGIAIVGGGIIFTAFHSQMQRMTERASLRTKSLDLVSTDASDVVSATVKNTGTVVFENVEIKILFGGGDNIILHVGRLAPGETGSDHAQGSPTLMTPGESYPVLITAESPDGDTVFSKATSARAH